MEEDWPVALIKDDFMFSNIQCMSPQGSSTSSSKSDGIYDSMYLKDTHPCHITNNLKSTINTCHYSNNNSSSNYLDILDGSPCSSSTHLSSSSSNCSPETLDFDQICHPFSNNTQMTASIASSRETDFLDGLTVSTSCGNPRTGQTFTEVTGILNETVPLDGDESCLTSFANISPLLSNQGCIDGSSSLCNLQGDNYSTNIHSPSLSSNFMLNSSSANTISNFLTSTSNNYLINEAGRNLVSTDLNSNDVEDNTIVVVKSEYDHLNAATFCHEADENLENDDEESDEEEYSLEHTYSTNDTRKRGIRHKSRSREEENLEFDDYSPESKRIASLNSDISNICEREKILKDKMIPLVPTKTRSKMHDLAVRHRLITNQNTRGQGQIQLSAEEKRTLIQEGYSLPTRLPLSRDEEEALKIVRRKIKNKLSAQESRRKRKEYMDTLEKKVHAYYGDNVFLKGRIKHLEQLNRDLILQIKKLQSTSQDSNNPQQIVNLSSF